jgi:hypothetical protein
VVGPDRRTTDGLANVARHARSVFNIGLFDSGLFRDSPIESLDKTSGANGGAAGIRTPESAITQADEKLPDGATLAAAQARFPVAVPEDEKSFVTL